MPWLSIPWLNDTSHDTRYHFLEHEQSQPLTPSSPTGKIRSSSLSNQELGPDDIPPPSTTALRHRFPWLLILLLSLILFWVLVRDDALTHQHTLNATSLGLDCGNTSTEALSKGCKFETINTAWIPAPCFDSHANDIYLAWANSSSRATGAFPYFKRVNDTSSRFRDVEELSLWQGISWVTREEHRAHCAWMLPLMAQRAWFQGKRKVELEHTEHCARESLKNVVQGVGRDDAGVIDVHNTLGFLKC